MNRQNEDILLQLLNDELDASDESDNDIIEKRVHNSNSEQSADEGNEVMEEGEVADQVLVLQEVAGGVPHVPEIESDGEAPNEPEMEEAFVGNTNELYLANDGTRWRITPHQNLRRRRRPCDLLRHLPGVRGEARNAQSPIEAFSLFFTDEMLEEFVRMTNIYLGSIRHKFSRPRDAADTNLTELKAVLGLLFLGGTMKVSHTRLEDLWNTDGTGIEYFRISMGINRFKMILKALKFDDFRSRDQRKTIDKLAAVRYLVDNFNENCKKHYNLSETVTIDEMLDGFRGRCSFKQYIPSKPAKYGIKTFALTDAKMYYTNNVEIYCGKQQPGPYDCSTKSGDVVRRLIQPITNSGQNVTCDNWFVSIPLAEELCEQSNLTLVGTIRKNRTGIPNFMKATRDRPVDSSVFAFRKNLTLVSYKPKKNKVVLAISTLHHEEASVEDGEENDLHKPKIITFYNATKSGVDKVDEMKCAYSVARITRRWTLVVMFSFLNIAGINAFVIYKANKQIDMPRKDFLKGLAKELLHGYVTERAVKHNIPTSIRLRLAEILGQPAQQQIQGRDQEHRGQGRCSLCDRKKNRPASRVCKGCNKFVCGGHTFSYLCQECDGKMQVVELENPDSE